MPTPVLGTKFIFTVADDRISLEWSVPVEAGIPFQRGRAEVANGVTGAFTRISHSVDATLDGRVPVQRRHVEMGNRYVYRLNRDAGVVNGDQRRCTCR